MANGNGSSIKNFEHSFVKGAGLAAGAIVGLWAIAHVFKIAHGMERKWGWYDYF